MALAGGIVLVGGISDVVSEPSRTGVVRVETDKRYTCAALSRVEPVPRSDKSGKCRYTKLSMSMSKCCGAQASRMIDLSTNVASGSSVEVANLLV